MWQRNDTGHVVDVAAHPDDEHPDRKPFAVGPGEVVDYGEPLAGFAEADPPVAEQSESDAEPAAKTSRKRAATAPDSEGVDR